MMGLPRITFGIIVLNGEPFTRYNLRSLYPFAHEIIVVEGASIKASDIATPEGHSTDGTLEVLHSFVRQEDPQKKVKIVTAEDEGHPQGFWPGEKDEQSQAYAKRATGDYLWQVDIDEFYQPEDTTTILRMLNSDASITQINFRWLYFWGGFDYLVDGLFIQRHYRDLGGGVPRVFKWGPGYRYVSHRPPTVVNANNVDARSGNWIRGEDMARGKIYCYHYASIFTGLVKNRIQYYNRQNWAGHDRLTEWFETNFVQIQKPFHIHHVFAELSWLTRFGGAHPPQIQQLISDTRNGYCQVPLRNTDDIEKLLLRRRYNFGVFLLQRLAPLLIWLRPRFPRLERLTGRIIEYIFAG